MNKMLVAVIDTTKARFLMLEPAKFPEQNTGSRFVELDSLLNPSNESPGHELWSSTKTGRNTGVGTQAHSYDDHRENHVAEFERRFARSITHYIVELSRTHQMQQLILVAEAQMIGFLRNAIATSELTHIQIHGLTKNLCQLKPLELQKYLANQGLIPKPQRISN
jgi:protein required for attachment to host cells